MIWHVTMSLDGFIAGRNDSMDWVVAQWSDGGETTRDIEVQRSAVADEVLQGAEAILGGVARRRHRSRPTVAVCRTAS